MHSEDDDNIDKAEVRALLEIWLKSLTPGDIEAMIVKYAPDIAATSVLFAPGKKVHRPPPKRSSL
jgi:hypothetical protein